MSGIFGAVSQKDCTLDLLYGIDYQTHLGTEYGGIAVFTGKRIYRQIHDISQSQFKSKFYGRWSTASRLASTWRTAPAPTSTAG